MEEEEQKECHLHLILPYLATVLNILRMQTYSQNGQQSKWATGTSPTMSKRLNIKCYLAANSCLGYQMTCTYRPHHDDMKNTVDEDHQPGPLQGRGPGKLQPA